MLGHVAVKVLDELTLARMILSGEIEVEKLPPIPEASGEPDHRRLVALNIIRRLSYVLLDVMNVAESADRSIYEMVEGLELQCPLPVTEEKRAFGFAAARQTA